MFRDKEKQRKSQHESYIRNKDKVLNSNNNRRKILRLFVKDILLKEKCYFCGEKDAVCLDFHHKDSKIKYQSISRMVANIRNKEKILDEIKKCTVICSNCHRRLHAGLLKLPL